MSLLGALAYRTDLNDRAFRAQKDVLNQQKKIAKHGSKLGLLGKVGGYAAKKLGGGALTALLAPTLGPMAPFVANAIATAGGGVAAQKLFGGKGPRVKPKGDLLTSQYEDLETAKKGVQKAATGDVLGTAAGQLLAAGAGEAFGKTGIGQKLGQMKSDFGRQLSSDIRGGEDLSKVFTGGNVEAFKSPLGLNVLEETTQSPLEKMTSGQGSLMQSLTKSFGDTATQGVDLQQSMGSGVNPFRSAEQLGLTTNPLSSFYEAPPIDPDINLSWASPVDASMQTGGPVDKNKETFSRAYQGSFGRIPEFNIDTVDSNPSSDLLEAGLDFSSKYDKSGTQSAAEAPYNFTGAGSDLLSLIHGESARKSEDIYQQSLKDRDERMMARNVDNLSDLKSLFGESKEAIKNIPNLNPRLGEGYLDKFQTVIPAAPKNEQEELEPMMNPFTGKPLGDYDDSNLKEENQIIDQYLNQDSSYENILDLLSEKRGGAQMFYDNLRRNPESTAFGNELYTADRRKDIQKMLGMQMGGMMPGGVSNALPYNMGGAVNEQPLSYQLGGLLKYKRNPMIR